ncbi:hypothetical protein GOP47_0021501 [Adiantum capillus-veneris]|uniref:SUN domain-containing protein n=1 Tax=Adiantum capillus-veneris TaxID=13818 RepID=A0A9D4U9E5_ADICA|nr:hypothetical protein GOP47_0021501 [Adiantum capillus-veneris]
MQRTPGGAYAAFKGVPTASGGVAGASPLPATVSMATSSPAPRLSTRKRRPVLDSTDVATPLRRSSGDDPSLMVAGTVELAGGDSLPEKTSLPRSSSKMVSQAADSTPRRDAIPSRAPKVMKLSLKATKPSGGSADAVPGARSHLLRNLFSRPFLTVIFMAFLFTTMWNWRAPPPSSLHANSMEGQVAELEEILRKTTKMMQVQLDLVDMKIHKEVEGLRKELEEKIDVQATTFGTELRNMLARAEDIEASLKSLMNAGFPSRKDVLGLINAVVDERAAEGTGKALSLDDVRAVARRLVEVELEKHAADGIGRVDYALGSGGAKVVDHSEGFYHGLRIGWLHLAGGFLPGASNKHSLANKILEPSFGEPGQCLPLKGSNVYVEIALRTSIFPDSFSLEHVAKSVAYDVSSAPKEFRVFGWLDSFKKDDAARNFMSQVLLGSFEYDIEKKYVQSFPVSEELRGRLINMVRLEVLSNYGSPSHTCIYRFRVHGSESKVILPTKLEGSLLTSEAKVSVSTASLPTESKKSWFPELKQRPTTPEWELREPIMVG